MRIYLERKSQKQLLETLRNKSGSFGASNRDCLGGDCLAGRNGDSAGAYFTLFSTSRVYRELRDTFRYSPLNMLATQAENQLYFMGAKLLLVIECCERMLVIRGLTVNQENAGYSPALVLRRYTRLDQVQVFSVCRRLSKVVNYEVSVGNLHEGECRVVPEISGGAAWGFFNKKSQKHFLSIILAHSARNGLQTICDIFW